MKAKQLLNLLIESSEVMPMAKAAELVKDLKNDDGSMRNWIDNPESSRAPQEVNVQMQDGKVIGWAGLGTTRIERRPQPLISVFVDPAYRGKGIGKALVQAVLKRENPEDTVYHDPDAEQLGDWIEDAGFDAEPIPREYFEGDKDE